MALFERDVRGILAGAVVSLVAIGLSGTGRSEIGGPLLLLGWALLGWSIHRFGRSEGR